MAHDKPDQSSSNSDKSKERIARLARIAELQAELAEKMMEQASADQDLAALEQEGTLPASRYRDQAELYLRRAQELYDQAEKLVDGTLEEVRMQRGDRPTIDSDTLTRARSAIHELIQAVADLTDPSALGVSETKGRDFHHQRLSVLTLGSEIEASLQRGEVTSRTSRQVMAFITAVRSFAAYADPLLPLFEDKLPILVQLVV